MPNPNNSKTNTHIGRLPYSGRIIAAVMQAFDIEIESPDPRTVRRYLSGKSINERNETDFFLSLGEALVERGIVPVPEIFDKYDVSMPIIAGCTIARAANKWDRLVGILQSNGSPNLDLGVAVAGFLRLMVIDLAVRVFALLRMCKTPTPAPETPSWAYENAGGLMLRELLAESGLTRKQLAARMEVSDTSIDNWFDGKVKPTRESLSMLGDHLAELLPKRLSDSLHRRIQLQFALGEIGDLLAAYIGRETVMEIATALYRFVWLMTEDVNRMNRPPIEEAVGLEFDILRLGTDGPQVPILLRNLELDVSDPVWKSYIWAASSDWQITFETIALQATGGSCAAGLAQDLYDVPALSDEQAQLEANAIQEMYKPLPIDFRGLTRDGLYNDSLEHLLRYWDLHTMWRRRIVEQYPLSANAHFQLGSYLGMVAKHLGNSQYLEEGIAECKIAADLLPGWDGPPVEVAIMLANVREFDRAFRELEWARTMLTEPTPHFEYCLGYVLMNLGRYQDALNSFERVIAAAPTYALALDDAARCAFHIGDKKKGRRYAKQSKRAGRPYSYYGWKLGAYSKTRGRNMQASSTP